MARRPKTSTALFALDAEADLQGSGLRIILEGVTERAVAKRFGRPLFLEDPLDAGYSGTWYFTEAGTGRPVSLYFRHNIARIGAHDQAVAERFLRWFKGL